MLKVSFFDMFFMYLRESSIRRPEVLGLKDFSSTELMLHGYDLVGDVTDFHFYEKDYFVNYYNKGLNIVFKRYFYLDKGVGNGLSVGKGVSLISLLKYYRDVCFTELVIDPVFDFYFSDGKEEGAVILNGDVVVRFNRWSSKGQYSVVTVESDFSESELFGDVSTGAVKKTMTYHDYNSMFKESRLDCASNAFCRLFKFLSR